MLEAQAQKERTSGTRDGDGRVDDGHLCNLHRALNNDGTPVRSTRHSTRRSGGEEEDEDGDDGLRDPMRSSSPPPRSNTQPRHGGDSATRQDKRQGRTSRHASIPHVQLGSARHIDTAAASGKDSTRAGPQRSAARHVNVDHSSRSDEEAPAVLSHATHKPREMTSTAAPSLPLPEYEERSIHEEKREEGEPQSTRPMSRSISPSPPPVTMGDTSLTRRGSGPLPKPITASLQSSVKPKTAEALKRETQSLAAAAAAESHCAKHVGQRPPPLLQPEASVLAGSTTSFTTRTSNAVAVTGTAAREVLISPASPPLRAGVSPRMLPRHPTRFDPSGGTASPVAAFVTYCATSASSAMMPSPSLSPVQQQQQQSHSSVHERSPLDVAQQLHVTSGDESSMRGTLPEEKEEGRAARSSPQQRKPDQTVVPAVGEDGWHSIPPSPLPLTQPAEYPVLPLSSSCAAVTDLEETPPPLPPPATAAADDSVSVEDSRLSWLTNSTDRVHYPHMRDFSGFHNSGNDCYGCSALTMLLRSIVFRRELLSSPLVAAVRRYESLVTRRPERRVQWTSGYVETPPSVLTAARRAKKRGRGGERVSEETVMEVCGLPALDAGTDGSAPAQTVDGHENSAHVSSSREVQQTLVFVDTLTLEELEEVLHVDPVTEQIPVTLHSALAALARAQRWREHMTCQINSTSTPPSVRQRLMEEKIYHENDRLFNGQVYTYGIRLNTIASLLQDEFFVGEQEDAHELFVTLMARLETEAVEFQRGCSAVLEARRSEVAQSHDNDEEGEGTAEPLDTLTANNATAATTTSSAGVDGVTPSVAAVAPTPSLTLSTDMAHVWINALVRTRLLNIIRCRSPGCLHEIVTDEICVNLSLHIPEEGKEEEDEDTGDKDALADPQLSLHSSASASHADCPPRHPPQRGPPHADDNGKSEDFSFPCLEPPTDAPASSLPPPSADSGPSSSPLSCCSVAGLLHHSMAFEPLSDYKCDACGLKSQQYQGGCFYARPPRVLVLQLKRFSTEFVNGAVRIQKNSRPVAAGDILVIYALPSKEELQEQLQQREGLRPSLRTVTRSETEAEVRGCVLPKSIDGAATTTLDAVQERGLVYDAAKKCFDDVAHTHTGCSAAGAVANPEQSSPSPSWVTAIRSVYRLQSCVLHLGQSLHFGHYVADFAVEGEAELSMDDAATRKTEVVPSKSGGTFIDTPQECREAAEEENNEEYEGVQLPAMRRDVPSTVAATAAADGVPLNPYTSLRPCCWRRANDEHVEVLDESAVRSRRAGRSDTYLLLYEKIQEEWVRCSVDAVLPRPVYPKEASKK
jgi:hypothetical protein